MGEIGKSDLVWPVVTCSESSLARGAIQRRQLQWRSVHQHEIPPPISIDLIKATIDTIHVIRDRRLVEAAIRQEGIASKIVGANPQGIHRVIALPVRVKRVRVRGSIDELAVCDESIDFVHDVWEWPVDGSKITVDLVVVTDCSGNSVVVKLCAGVV